jgi:hypothetical protein
MAASAWRSEYVTWIVGPVGSGSGDWHSSDLSVIISPSPSFCDLSVTRVQATRIDAFLLQNRNGSEY